MRGSPNDSGECGDFAFLTAKSQIDFMPLAKSIELALGAITALEAVVDDFNSVLAALEKAGAERK